MGLRHPAPMARLIGGDVFSGKAVAHMEWLRLVGSLKL